ncbi:MAG: hypothetical protein LBH43_00650 [Treponema sp.]|nr:hypothetical protein [Treponema sp.]
MKREEWEEKNGYGKSSNAMRCCQFCVHSTGRKAYPVHCYLLKGAAKASAVRYSSVCSNFERRV